MGTGAVRVATKIGDVMDNLKRQNELRKSNKLRNMIIKESETTKLLKDLTVPNNDSNVIHGNINNDKTDIIDPNKPPKTDIIDPNPPKIPPKKNKRAPSNYRLPGQFDDIELQLRNDNIKRPVVTPPPVGGYDPKKLIKSLTASSVNEEKQSSIQMTNLNTPVNNKIQVGTMGASPYVYINDPVNNFETKSFKGNNESNTVKFLLKQSQAYRKDRYDGSKGQTSMKTPYLGGKQFAKVDNNYALDEFGNLVSRIDHETIHPLQPLDLNNPSTYSEDNETGSFRTPKRFSNRLTNQQVLDWFKDPDNLPAVKRYAKNNVFWDITSHHMIDEDGNVTDIINPEQPPFDPDAENTQFSEAYKTELEEKENIIVEEPPGFPQPNFEAE